MSGVSGASVSGIGVSGAGVSSGGGGVAPPVADFSGTPLSGAEPLEVAFTNLSTGTGNTYLWDFGDMSTSTETNPIHEFPDAGTYTVSLTATNAGGSDEEVKTDYIEVEAAAAFPVVETTAISTQATAVTSHPITLPSGVAVGDLLLLFFASDGTVTNSLSSAWDTVVASPEDFGFRGRVYARVATGSDALTITTTAETSVAVCYRISGAGVPSGVAQYNSVAASTYPLPPHTPAGGSQKYLWVVGVVRNGSATPSGSPDSYSAIIGDTADSGTAGVRLDTAWRTNEAASESPGPFTGPSAITYGYTVAVPPA